MGDYFTKNHPPYHHREVCATYLYMENSLLKIDHKIVQEWKNAVIKPIYTVEIMPIRTVAITPNCTIVQGCANVVRTCIRTHKKHNSNIVRMSGGGTWNPVPKKYIQMLSCSLNKLNTRLTHGRLSYLW